MSSTTAQILYIVGQLGPGGMERQLYDLLKSMDRERVQPAVAVWNFHKNDAYVSRLSALGINLYGFEGIRFRAKKLLALRRLVRKLGANVVHSYAFYTNIVAYWSVLGTNAIPIGSVQSDFYFDIKASGPLLGRLNARWPRNQIFNSRTAAENARRSSSIFSPRRVFVARNGVDLTEFKCSPPPSGEQVRILGVGSLLKIKRWERLILASRELKRSGLDFVIQIAGDGPLRSELEAKARDLGVGDRVKFIGYSDNVACLLLNSHFLVHTSESEGCPNVILEAMASARPVISTDAGEVPVLVEDGKTGFVVGRAHDETLVDRIAKLIRNPDLCTTMGKAAREKAEREFTLSQFVTAMFDAYEALGWKIS